MPIDTASVVVQLERAISDFKYVERTHFGSNFQESILGLQWAISELLGRNPEREDG